VSKQNYCGVAVLDLGPTATSGDRIDPPARGDRCHVRNPRAISRVAAIGRKYGSRVNPPARGAGAESCPLD
jgi:hypothetical protein